MPNVGLYDNSGPMKGIGPVESPGGFIHLWKKHTQYNYLIIFLTMKNL
jgi:hypothetical protein